jgi:hypothetical protein
LPHRCWGKHLLWRSYQPRRLWCWATIVASWATDVGIQFWQLGQALTGYIRQRN